MKKIYIAITAIAVFGLASCSKYEDFQVDPNRTTQATPDLLLTTIERLAFNEVNTGAALASRQLAYTDGVSDQQYYGWQRGSFSDYSNLRQVLRMEKEAVRVGKPAYQSVAKFFRAYFGIQLTMSFGDIPFSEALKGDEAQYTSTYDTQESVFLQALELLEQASSELANIDEPMQGDVVYDGSILKWRKLINSYTLRVLTYLSSKESNTAFNLKQRFAAIVNDPSAYPLFTGNADNAQLKFHDIQGNRYPHYNDNSMQTAYYMAESFVDTLRHLQDPRLFLFAAKAPIHADLEDGDFNAYGGLNGSAPITENTEKVVAGEASKINPRYYTDPVNEASVAFGYAELQFILAEAVVRGWITGSAETFYKEGILANMMFYGIANATIEAYLSSPNVALQAGNEISDIMVQKYIASFMQGGWQPFFEQRRTGYPLFDVSGGGVLNDAKIPKRWMYPEAELQLNRASVNEAIERQFAGADNVNGEMWLLK
ncbi:SusD/RagB family nutrient-binding outer membrane lipoprotein [Flavihumibacter sp. ZG627]|uniref:SusD/RagB family nutrient-binding outer membrane lipoprotein n=1 Tax=Flavihumibacter sp. ZG627 TaxID=1463156 RepID=UPI000693B02F|nr:SusD/RagB family nutrient-binding outer membrane lipoprotein [Flavihumibacter sp. ZG627]